MAKAKPLSSIKITKDLKKKLMRIKLDEEYKSIDQVIYGLFKKIRKAKK